jgi:COMPASS component SWD3
MGKQQQWLDLAELGLLLSTFVTVVWSFFGGIWQTPMVFLWLTLSLNTFNRLSFQRRQRRQFMGSVKHLDYKLQTQIQQLSLQVQQSSNIKSSIAKVNSKQEMQDYLGSLEKSLTNVVQYLNQEALDERIKHIEQTLLMLQQENIHQTGNFEPQFGNAADINAVGQTPPAGIKPGISPAMPPNLARTMGATLNDPWDASTVLPATSPVETPQQSWQCVRILDAHKDCVSCLDFSDDLRLLASGSWDQQLKVWQVTDGKQLSQIRAHQQGLLNLCFLDGFMDRLLGGLLDGDVQPYAIATSSFEPDVKLWHLDVESADIPEFQLQRNFQGHNTAVYAIAATSMGQLLTASHDQTIRSWNPKDGSLIATGLDEGDQIQAIACAPEGNVFITAGKEGLLKFWRMDDHAFIGSLGSDQPEAIAAIAIRPDGELFVSGCENGELYLWQLDLNNLETLPDAVPCYRLPAHNKAITKVLFSAQGHYLVTACVDGTIKIWQIGINTPLATLHLNDPETGGNARLLSLALSNDGSLLAAGSSDGKIKVWLQQ